MAKKTGSLIVILAPLALGIGLLVFGIATSVLVQGLAAHRVAAALTTRTSTQTAAIVSIVVGALLLMGGVALSAVFRVPVSALGLTASAVALVGFGLLGYGIASYGAQEWSLVSQIGRAVERRTTTDRLALLFTVIGAVLGAGGLVAALAAGRSSRAPKRRRR